MNILSQQNLLKITSKILFDDVTVTSLYLSAIHYNQKIEHAPIINCWKFHQVRIKTKKIMEGGGIPPPPPLDWATSKKLGLDRVEVADLLFEYLHCKILIMYFKYMLLHCCNSSPPPPPVWLSGIKLLVKIFYGVSPREEDILKLV